MSLILTLAAFSIDIAQWQVGRHRAQVAADATALAAANCLATTACPTTANATSKANGIAGDDGFSNPNNVSYAYTSSTVKVTVTNPVHSSFAGLFGLPSVTASASATASYNSLTGQKWGCASSGGPNCISLFAGNDNCPSSSPSSNDVGLSLVTNDHGSGNETMTGLYSNGYYYNGGASGSFALTTASPACQWNNEKKASNTTFTSTGTGPVSYPAVWAKPACTYSQPYFSTTASPPNQILAPGVYCATGTLSGGCSQNGYSGSGSGTSYAGYIDVDMSTAALSGQSYEFVGPCAVLSGSTDVLSNISGQPLVYGTSNVTTSATTTALPTCTTAADDGSAGTSTWLTGNGAALDAPVYDQCGTFEDTGNNSSFVGFVESWNIILDKNGAVQGDGPTSATNPQVTSVPGSDALTG